MAHNDNAAPGHLPVAERNPYPHLFRAFNVGRLQLANRLVVLAHGTGMVRDGLAMPADIAYWERLACAGAGLMITGGMTVHPAATLRHHNRIEAYSSEAVAGLAQRCAAVKAHGIALLGQLTHIGRESTGGDSDFPPVGPSPVRSPRDLFAPHELDATEIAAIVEGFGRTALNLQRTGYDGVEIHGAHGYLVAQFLSPATNHRQDAYGGAAEKRLRLLREIVNAIRLRCGRDFLLSLRLSADEEIADGLGIADTLKITEAIARDGAIDLLNITLGVRGAYVKDAATPKAPAARAARLVREASGLPVIVGQRITQPALAEQILKEGAADLIGMARAFIADPQWIHKARANDAEAIRPCLGLNQDCRAFAPYLHCAVNPAAGRESIPEFKEIGRAARRRRVAVVGAGPAGLEAARVAAERGHAVTVYEATDAIGGQFLYAASVPHRSDLRGLIDFQRLALQRLVVSIELEARIAQPQDIPHPVDVVVIATGAVPRPVDAEFRDKGVLSCFDILKNGVPAIAGGNRAVLVDDGSGFWWTYGVAEAIVQSGWKLTIISASTTIPNHIPAESVGGLLARLGKGGAQYRVLTALSDVSEGVAQLINVTSGATEEIPADLVVMQAGRAAAPLAQEGFQARGIETHVIGDCVAPRRMSNALYEGYRVARAL